MKMFKVMLLAVALVGSNGVLAGTEKPTKSSAELKVTIEAQLDGRVILGFEKLPEETVQITIYDAAGSLIHSESVSTNTVILKRFDLSKYPAGKYSYMVSNDLFSVRKVIIKN